MLSSSERNHRIRLETNVPTRSSRGEAIPGWSLVTMLWAKIEPLSGRELYNAQQLNAEVTTRVTILYRTDVSAKDNRLVFRGQAFDILSVINPDYANRELILMCREVIEAA